MIFIDCQQGTPEWLAARIGVITASRFKDACDTLKTGKPSQKSSDYEYEIAGETVKGKQVGDTFVNYAMRRGTELEPAARREYEKRTGLFALEAGIVLTDDSRFGYSTDGFVDDDGLIEIKCPLNERKKIEMWETGDISEYMHQIQGGMWITGRKWCDFIMFDPDYDVVEKNLYIKRVKRDEAFIATMEEQLIAFMRRVDVHVEFMRKVAA